MTVEQVVARLREHNVILGVSDRKRLRFITLGDPLPEDLVDQVARVEAEIVELLTGRARREPERPRGGSSWPAAIGEHRREVGTFSACVLCQAGSWSRYAGAALCETCARDSAARVRLEYYFAVSRWFRLTVEGADAAIVLEAHQQVVALADSVGEPIGSSLRRRWERERQQPHGTCGGAPHGGEE